jgi:hypothetical protein
MTFRHALGDVAPAVPQCSAHTFRVVKRLTPVIVFVSILR